jgi:tryptophan halogenase
LHFDAGLVAEVLRGHAEALGVTRLDRRVEGVETAGDRITRLTFQGGETLEADLYIDCSGFRSLLLGEALGGEFHDWSGLLPCDRAVAMPCALSGPRTPYTMATARSAGWQWRIPLQHRVGNGYVYSSAHVSDDEAAHTLKASLDGEALAEPRLLRFRAGHRARPWTGNCVAIGLAAGFLEPLESTSIHLIHTGLGRLLDYWPDRSLDPALAEAFNRETADEYAHIRDFLLLHYVPNRRLGEPFWDAMRTLELPDTLTAKLALFEASGRLISRRRELFADVNWFHVAEGMGLKPRRWDPLVDLPDFPAVAGVMGQVKQAIHALRDAAPTHDAVLARLLDPAETRRPNFAVGADWAGR